MTTVQIWLTSAAIGDATKADYDAWVAFVETRVGEACGVDATVCALRYGEAGEDTVRYVDSDTGDRILDWLRGDGWESFCATPRPVTDADILALEAEAHAAKDWIMVEFCDRALAGDDAARAECQRVIDEARAMEVP